ncbi:hypothetical protein OEA41_006614 [Lepraria neglecta]|uniref:Uncharacterized protein n=1 Tax=Lepraria neglecta TaxID=209136 RepID=A0AAD9Z848_9LECA|nr:hypothetical protein OEA41_006614 [Lepraria neglecta]
MKPDTPQTSHGSTSAAPSIITVVSAARKASHGLHQLKALKDAPKGLDDILAEFTRTETVLQAFRNLPSNNPERSPDLATVLSMAERKLHELDALICYTLTKACSSDRVDRVQWIRKRLEGENYADR